MKINNDHMYHGAALTQIAEHPQFTAINAFKHEGETSRSAFLVNTDIGIFLKYAATKPTKTYKEYGFVFRKDNLDELVKLKSHFEQVFLCFVCVAAAEICCISYEDFLNLIAQRQNARGAAEDTYTVLVTALEGNSFRVYMNAPGERKKALGRMTVSRNKFPKCLFG
jgi:hypothetical protein